MAVIDCARKFSEILFDEGGPRIDDVVVFAHDAQEFPPRIFVYRRKRFVYFGDIVFVLPAAVHAPLPFAEIAEQKRVFRFVDRIFIPHGYARHPRVGKEDERVVERKIDVIVDCARVVGDEQLSRFRIEGGKIVGIVVAYFQKRFIAALDRFKHFRIAHVERKEFAKRKSARRLYRRRNAEARGRKDIAVHGDVHAAERTSSCKESRNDGFNRICPAVFASEFQRRKIRALPLVHLRKIKFQYGIVAL